MPNLPTIAQLRRFLPHAAKLLPLLTGVAPAAAAPPDLAPLNHRFGEIQTESRSLRTEVQGHGEQLASLQRQLDRLLANSERAAQAQETLAAALKSLSSLLKGLSVAILLLLALLTVFAVLQLMRGAHA